MEKILIGNTFLTNHKVSSHEAIKRVVSLPMRHSYIDVLYVPTSLKKINVDCQSRYQF